MSINIKKFGLRVVKESGGNYDLDKNVTKPLEAVKVVNEVVDLYQRAEEVFVIITLDVGNNMTGIFEVSVGSVNSSIVTPREVFKRAILQNADSIILAHNHPSGKVKPSSSDVDITERLVEIGDIIGIDVVDHIVVGDQDEFLSMREQGII